MSEIYTDLNIQFNDSNDTYFFEFENFMEFRLVENIDCFQRLKFKSRTKAKVKAMSNAKMMSTSE